MEQFYQRKDHKVTLKLMADVLPIQNYVGRTTALDLHVKQNSTKRTSNSGRQQNSFKHADIEVSYWIDQNNFYKEVYKNMYVSLLSTFFVVINVFRPFVVVWWIIIYWSWNHRIICCTTAQNISNSRKDNVKTSLWSSVRKAYCSQSIENQYHKS